MARDRKGGLQVGYIFTSIDGKTLAGPADLDAELQNPEPGAHIRLGYMFSWIGSRSRLYYPTKRFSLSTEMNRCNRELAVTRLRLVPRH